MVCPECGRVYEEIVFSCPKCDRLTVFRYHGSGLKIDKKEPGIWRYRSLLPRAERVVSKGEGLTPVSRIEGVLVKNERHNPTGTYSDRASSVIASYVASRRFRMVKTEFEEDFTYSLVYYLGGISEVIAIVRDPLSLDYSDVSVLSQAKNVRLTTEDRPEGSAHIGYVGPLTVEGLKTIAFEIYERRLRVERVVVPARSGLLAYSIWKGFKDLEEAGVDASYEVIAASIKGSDGLFLRHLGASVKVVEVGREEVLDSLLKLWRRGVSTKPLSVAAFTVSESIGNSVAVVTIGFRPLSGRRHQNAVVRREIIRILKNYGESTAYGVWRRLPLYTLRGVYKVLEAMEERGEVCSEVRSAGGRKVRYYRAC